MGSEWVETTLGKVTREGGGFIQTGPFGSQLHASDYVEDGVPCIMPANLSGDRVDTADIARISETDATRLSKHLVRTGDIIYSRRGDVTRKALITKNEEGMFCGTGCLLVRPGSAVNSEFLKYHLSTPENHEWIIRHAIGATMPNLNTGILAEIPLRIPPKETQKYIADYLGCIDRKIELNRQTNQTLESMAQALFKSWFVDFDPVIDNALAAGNEIPEPLAAKAATRRALQEQGTDKANQPHTLPDHIRQLFPSRFQFTEELGWIPEGWGVSTVGEEIHVCGGGTPSTKNNAYWADGTHAFCTPKDMSRLSGTVLMDTERKLTDEGLAQISSGLLPTGTVLMSSRAPIGYLAVNDIPVSVNQGIIAMLPHQSFSPLYLLLWTKSNLKEIENRANGSTFQEISKKNFRDIPMVVPGTKLLSEFGAIASELRTKMEACEKQIRVLTRLRDELLPKLLSGELRIPEAEEMLDEALA